MNSQKNKTMLFGIILIAFICMAGCNKIDTSEYTIINNGGAVETITANPDGESLSIVQAVPAYGTYNFNLSKASPRSGIEAEQPFSNPKSENLYPENLPIMFFFNSKLDLNSIKESFVVTVDGNEVKGTIVVNVTSKGNAVLTFTPWTSFGVDKEVFAVVKREMLSHEGKGMDYDLMIKFTTTASATDSFDNNKGFEKGNDGVFFAGDGAVRKGNVGPLVPFEGKNFAAISSGNKLVFKDGYAIAGASSLMVLGPINKKISNLEFYYDFISAEFNEYVDTEYDDTAIVTVYGPKGSYSEIITSVNAVGLNNLPFEGYPGMPDGGDDYVGHTGWLLYSANKLSSVGTPAYIIFTVTDVGDRIISSILAVDQLAY
jgi:hypothetical protein